jgi:hypothetical protein
VPSVKHAHSASRVAEGTSVRIREVSPRDGLQNEAVLVTTDQKVRLIELLVATGLKRIEVTSFVRPDAIPQLADGPAVLRGARVPADVELSVLIPNEHGLDRALAERPYFSGINYAVSASESHSRRNLNRSIAEAVREAGHTIWRARAEGLRVEGVISASFGCPYEGAVPVSRVLELAHRLVAAGAEEISFADTIGCAGPGDVAELLGRACQELGDEAEITCHFHDLSAGRADAIGDSPARSVVDASATEDPLRLVPPPVYFERLTGLRVGRSGKLNCLFHDDRTPSLHVYPEPERGWYCFGCGQGGSVFDLAALLWKRSTRGSDFVELRRELERRLL